jgi:A/G-specific adenine glycosylase
MLQQTQVATVIPYYHRFLKRFPDVRALASANIDEVYQHWAGLGYYRRARQLHEASIRVVQDYRGNFPDAQHEVQQLPGIGRYTANAILTFAGDARLPIVEANTQRLYARLLLLRSDTHSKQSQSLLWDFAERVLPAKNGSGQLNQALMEIGSQVCLPKSPTCLLCPLQQHCPTFAAGLQQSIPVPKKPKQYTDLKEAALVVRNTRGQFLMRRCDEGERWAGLWDFPRFDITNCVTEMTVRRLLSNSFEEKYGPSIEIGQSLHQLKHTVTRYRITLLSFEAAIVGSEGESGRGRIIRIDTKSTGLKWASRVAMNQLALNSSGKKLWAWLSQSNSKE